MDINEFYRKNFQKTINSIAMSRKIGPLIRFLYDNDGSDALKKEIIGLMTDALFEISKTVGGADKTTFSRDMIQNVIETHFLDGEKCIEKLREACERYYGKQYARNDKKTQKKKTTKKILHELFNLPGNFWPVYPVAAKMCVPKSLWEKHIVAPAAGVQEYTISVQAYNQDFEGIPVRMKKKAVMLGTGNLNSTYPTKMYFKKMRRTIIGTMFDYARHYGLGGGLDAQNVHVPLSVFDQVERIILAGRKGRGKKCTT